MTPDRERVLRWMEAEDFSTQADAAAALGSSQQFLSAWLLHDRQLSLSALRRWADAMVPELGRRNRALRALFVEHHG